MPETPEPADTVDTGKPPVPAVVPTQAAAPARLLPTAELSSRQRSEQMDAVVEQIVKLNQQVAKLTACDTATARDVRGLIARLNDTEATLQAVAHDCIRRTPPSGTFWQRVRWMVLGR